MEKVRQFAFEHGLLGERAPSPDFVGIEFTDGSILGSNDNVKFRFNAEYMRMARRRRALRALRSTRSHPSDSLHARGNKSGERIEPPNPARRMRSNG
jgi:hypothetical protein